MPVAFLPQRGGPDLVAGDIRYLLDLGRRGHRARPRGRLMGHCIAQHKHADRCAHKQGQSRNKGLPHVTRLPGRQRNQTMNSRQCTSKEQTDSRPLRFNPIFPLLSPPRYAPAARRGRLPAPGSNISPIGRSRPACGRSPDSGPTGHRPRRP